MSLAAALILMAVAGFATVTGPAGPPLTVAILVFAGSALWASHALADRWMP